MAVATRISLKEYLNTSFEPDCDYVDGVLEERNVGKNRHSRTQSRIIVLLAALANERGYEVMTEQRVQVSPSRVRIPDVCLIRQDDRDEITQRPPLLWIEILSPDDRFNRIVNRLQDSLDMGVQMIWLIDPYSKKAWMLRPGTPIAQVNDGVLRCANPNLELPISDMLPDY